MPSPERGAQTSTHPDAEERMMRGSEQRPETSPLTTRCRERQRPARADGAECSREEWRPGREKMPGEEERHRHSPMGRGGREAEREGGRGGKMRDTLTDRDTDTEKHREMQRDAEEREQGLCPQREPQGGATHPGVDGGRSARLQGQPAQPLEPP